MTTQSQPDAEADIRQCLEAKRYPEAFERIVDRYSQKIFHLALSMVSNPSQAEDLVQDVLVKVWKHLPGYHGAASVSTWIYVITRNSCLTELKRRAARPTVSLQDPEFEASAEHLTDLHTDDPESGVEMDARQLLQALPEKYRRVVSLFYLEQKSYEEVGALLDLPIGTVKTFLFRARKQMLELSRRRPAPVPAREIAYAAATT